MTVAAILEAKGRAVFTTSPDMTLAAAVEMLAEKKVGAVVIVEKDQRVCGILSERDIVREIAASGPDVLSQPVSICMTRKVISCAESDTIDHVMGIMSTNRFRHLPVVAKRKLVGLISIGDVVKRKIEQAERDAEELRNYIATG